MASFGKKILSAFIDIDDEPSKENTEENSAPVSEKTRQSYVNSDSGNEKFRLYFEKLFQEANFPGPGYFEFLKMVEAMQSIADEKTRYVSAFAGLSVQGLDKTRLMDSAREYLKILDTDAQNFNSTINNALNEKVESRKRQLEDKTKRIQELTREITDLNNSVLALGNEIKESEDKIRTNVSGYAAELEKFKSKINQDIQKINTLI